MVLVNLVLRSALEKWKVPEIKKVSDFKGVLPENLWQYMCWYYKPEGIQTIKLLEAFHITPTIFLQIYLQTSVLADSKSQVKKQK